MFCDYIPGTKISTLEEALDQNMLATFVLVSTSYCTSCSKTIYIISQPNRSQNAIIIALLLCLLCRQISSRGW